jgi:hypothetical protein
MTLKVSSSSKSNNMIQILVIILLVAVFVYLVYNYFSKEPVQNAGAVSNSNEKMPSRQMMNTTKMMVQNDGQVSITSSTPNTLSGMSNPIMEKMNGLYGNDIVGEDNMGMMSSNLNENFSNDRVKTDFPKDTLTPEQLLPQDNSSTWNQVNPSGEGSLKDRNFLQSGFHIGINTVGQTLRNANLQLRSEPPCPQVKVSPWMTSTIEPDVSRRPFEIAGC